MDEVFRMVKAQLGQFDLQHQIGAGVVLTGGGARMKGIVELAEEVFGLPCMVGRPVDADGITALLDGPEYAAPVGMIRYGLRSVEHRTSSGFGGFISKIFKR
jgi:cell division protein FtsA